MARGKQEETQSTRQGNIHVRVIDQKQGLQVIESVAAIRILSKKYRLLVMEDYTPMLGKVEGDVVVLTADREIEYRSIHAYYKLQHNEFTLLIDYEMAQEQGCSI